MSEVPETLPKAHQSIEISNNITLLQRQAFNVMYACARNHLKSREWHELPTATLAKAINASNNPTLRKKIKQLQSIQVCWNVLESGKMTYHFASLVGEIKFNDSICQYFFTPGIRELLLQKPYTNLSLAIQKNFLSKHSQALWEYCHQYINTQSGSTGWQTIKEVRHFFGITDKQYKAFKEFNRRVLNPALTELNEVSDIRVNLEFRRTKQKITHLRFLSKHAGKEKLKQINDKPKKAKIPAFREWFNNKSKIYRDLFDANFEARCDVDDPIERSRIYDEQIRIAMAEESPQMDLFNGYIAVTQKRSN